MSETFHWDSLPSNTRRALEALNVVSGFTDFYLAGGTALALQIGHRLSHDLDFFSAVNQLDFSAREILRQQLRACAPCVIQREADGMVYATIMEVEVSFIYQHHPPLEPLLPWENMALAGLTDIGLMKLAAIKDRGTRRDFVDLYCLREDAPLEKLFDLLPRKFADRPSFALHLAYSLRYFEDAENDPRELVMRRPVRWENVKKYCEGGARLLTKRNTGLGAKGL
jgi:hypothetical protein